MHHTAVTATPPSGDQVELVHGSQRAIAVTVGGGLRTYEVDGSAVLDGYAEDEACDGARGQVLVPWPNRLRHGAYEFGGRHLQLPLTEPEAGNAIHGLARWTPWRVLWRRPEEAALGLDLPPQPGFPFQLRLAVGYRLGPAGLSVRQTATNIGAGPCPYGSGAHPYLCAGTELVDECELTVPATTRLVVDDHQIPVGSAPVAGTELDFGEPRRIGGLRLDTAYTDLGREADGLARVTLSGARTVRLWVDRAHPYLMVFTGDTLEPARRRRGLAVEPMTCAPDAFRSDAGVRVLQPGEAFAAEWGIAVGD